MAVNSEKRFDAGDTGKSSSFFILCLCSNLFYLCPYGCTGLYDPKNIGQFYTTNMDISGTACLVKSFDRVARDALKADMEHLSAEYSSQQEYLDSIDYKLSQCAEHGDAVGREKELRMLKGFLSKKGRISFVSGGPSVGKSKLIKQAIKDVTARGNPTKVKVILLDGRDVESLPDALAKKAGKEKKI